MRTSVMLTRWLCSVSSCTSPRWSNSLSTWRTCSPMRSRRTDRPSGVSMRRISFPPSPLCGRGKSSEAAKGEGPQLARSTRAPSLQTSLPRGERGLSSKRPRALLDLEHLEHVAGLDVVSVGEHHAAFEAGAHFGDVVLEPPQRRDRRRGNDDV